MRTAHRSPTLTSISGMIPWLLKLATWMLARGLNMPEPLLHHTGVFVFARVAASRTASAGRSAQAACCVTSGTSAADRGADFSIAPNKAAKGQDVYSAAGCLHAEIQEARRDTGTG